MCDLIRTISEHSIQLPDMEHHQDPILLLERYRLILEGSNDGIWDWDIPSDRIYWNDRMYEMLGLPRKGAWLSKQEIWPLIHPDDLVMSDNIRKAHLDKDALYELEVRIKHASGEYRYFLSKGKTIRDKAGNPLRISGTLSDITDLKVAELENRELLKRERLIRRVSDLISQSFDISHILAGTAREVVDCIEADRCVLSRYTRVEGGISVEHLDQYCREGVSPVNIESLPLPNLLELPYGEDANHPWLILNYPHPDAFPDFYRAYAELSCIQSVLILEITCRDVVYGRLIVHQCTSPRTWREEEITLLELVAKQVGAMLHQAELYQAEQAAKEQAEIANRQKSQFLANMSHEFRTPLNAVIGFSEMLAMGTAGPLNEKQQRYLENITASGKHLLELVNDLLDLEKVEADKLSINKETVSLEPLMAEIAKVFETMAHDRKITLAYQLHSEMTHLEADPVRLRQILQNLISNAIKFNRDGGSVTVSCEPDAKNGHAVFRVRDTGVGIAPEHFSLLFTMFSQLDNSYSRRQEGTGLGLALTKRLVELQGGTISVESRLDEGSVFTFTLPLKA